MARDRLYDRSRRAKSQPNYTREMIECLLLTDRRNLYFQFICTSSASYAILSLGKLDAQWRNFENELVNVSVNYPFKGERWIFKAKSLSEIFFSREIRSRINEFWKCTSVEGFSKIPFSERWNNNLNSVNRRKEWDWLTKSLEMNFRYFVSNEEWLILVILNAKYSEPWLYSHVTKRFPSVLKNSATERLSNILQTNGLRI